MAGVNQNETRLELRARKLGDAINRRVDTIATGLRPPGQRPSFTTMLSQKDALSWWLKNWGNPDTGQKVLAQMDPSSQLELHAALSQHIESQGLMGGTMNKAQTMAAPGIGAQGMGANPAGSGY